MRIGISGVAAIALTVAIAGCASTPNSGRQYSGSNSDDGDQVPSVSVQAVVDHIRCELYAAAKPGGELGDPALAAKLMNYDAVALLSLKVDERGHLVTSDQQDTWSARHGGDSHERAFVEAYRFSISNIVALTDAKDCANDAAAATNHNAPALEGDLGIADVARVGLTPFSKENISMVAPAPFGIGSVSSSAEKAANDEHRGRKKPNNAPSSPGGSAGALAADSKAAQARGLCANTDPAKPTFGTGLLFKITRTGGAFWSPTQFRFSAVNGTGPGAAETDSELANVTGGGAADASLRISHVDTDQLWISFVPQKQVKLARAMQDDTQNIRDQEKTLATLNATIEALKRCQEQRECTPGSPESRDAHTLKLLIDSDTRLLSIGDARLRAAKAGLEDHTRQYLAYASATDCESHRIINTMISANK